MNRLVVSAFAFKLQLWVILVEGVSLFVPSFFQYAFHTCVFC